MFSGFSVVPIALVLGWPEALVVVGLALLVFGRRIPDAARSLGLSIVELRRALAGGRRDVAGAADDRARSVRDVGEA